MLNQVHLEGYTTNKTWQYSGDTFFRLAVYRDPDLPHKDMESNGHTDYVTVRLPAGTMLLTDQIRAGLRLQVHGWLESRQYSETLADFLGKANAQVELNGTDPEEVTVKRGSDWVVATRILLVPEQNGG